MSAWPVSVQIVADCMNAILMLAWVDSQCTLCIPRACSSYSVLNGRHVLEVGASAISAVISHLEATLCLTIF